MSYDNSKLHNHLVKTLSAKSGVDERVVEKVLGALGVAHCETSLSGIIPPDKIETLTHENFRLAIKVSHVMVAC